MALVVSSTSKLNSGFSPTSIPNCALWLDAADPAGTGVIPTNGSSLSTWTDKSGNGNSMSATGSPLPTYNSASKTISYNGSSYFQKLGLTFTDYTFFAIANKTSGSGPLYTNTTTKSGYTGFFSRYSGNGNYYIVRANATELATNWASGTSMFSDGTTYLYTVQYAADSNVNVWSNGGVTAAITTTQTGPITQDSILIGSRNVAGFAERWIGTFSEIIQYNTTLSASERRQVEGYLAAKWGLTSNLPASHPFKSIAPIIRPFQPIDISGCALWLDAGDPSTVTLSGSSVTAWRDKSGNGRNTSGGVAPTYSQNGVVFTGSQYLPVTNASGLFVNTAFSFFIVETLGGSTANRFFIGDDVVNTGTNSSFHIGYRSNSNVTFAFYYNDLEITGLSGTGAARIWSFNMPATANRNARLNGSLVGTLGNSQKLTAMTTLVIGRCFGVSYYTGTISEIIGFVKDMTTSEIQQIEGYLSTKWGLKSTFPSTHPYKSLPVFTATFTPLQLTGCQLWLDAADASTLTLSGSNVTQWNDKSGNGRNALVSGTAYATYSNSGLYFANSLYTTTLSADPTSETSFLVFNNPSGAGNGCIIGAYNGGRELANYDTNKTIGILKSQIQWGPYTTFPSFGTKYIATSIISPSSTSILVNGGTTSNSGSALTFTSGSNTLLGREVGLNFGVTGFLHEFIVFSSVLTTAQRQQVEGYLAAKWGLQSSLPTTHPFRTIKI